MQEFKIVLCATDLSEAADVAIREADRRARLFGAELVLLHVLPTMYPGVPMFPHQLERALVERERLSSEVIDLLLDRVALLTGRGPDAVSVIVDDGSPSQAILARAEELAADLIVVGTGGHGTPRMERLVLGRTADQVLRHATCSVLVARACPVTKRVLIASDLSESSALALEIGTEEARRRGARVTVVHSLDVVSPGLAMEEPASVASPGLVAHPVHEMRAVAERTMEQTMVPYGLGAEKLVSEEPVRLAIVHAAETTGADVIVLGTTGRTGLDRLLLGSVAERVVHEAPCSVLVVRERPGRDTRPQAPGP